jgi:diaminopimelate decarboxylase
LWGLERDPTGSLHLGSHRLSDLIDAYGSPIHVVDASAIDRNADAAIAPIRSGQGADVFSSYKTNPVPAVLDRLHRRGIGAEAISPYELWLAFELGVPGDRIIYNGPAKSEESLRTAADRRVALVNANSLGDVALMAKAAADTGKRMNAGLRVSLPHMWGGQFGIAGTSPLLLDAVREAQHAASLDLIGLHFHSGFPITDLPSLRTHLDKVLRCCDRIRAETDWSPTVLDLGGSLRCPTVYPNGSVPESRRRSFSIAEASTAMSEIVTRHMRHAGAEPPALMIEPGQSLTGDTQFLLTTVLDIRSSADGARTVVLDVGTELAEPARSENHRVFALVDSGTASIPCRVVGPRATTDDVLIDAAMLPELSPGDGLAIMDTGAYFVPFSTASSFPRPPILMVDGTAAWIVRSREDLPHRRSLERD